MRRLVILTATIIFLILGLTVAAVSLSQTPLTNEIANLTKNVSVKVTPTNTISSKIQGSVTSKAAGGKQTVNGTGTRSTGLVTLISPSVQTKIQSVLTPNITKTTVTNISNQAKTSTIDDFLYLNNKKNANITTINDFVIYWNRTDSNPFTNMKGTGTSELLDLIYLDGTRIIIVAKSSQPVQVSVGGSKPTILLSEGDTIIEFPDGTYDVIKNNSTFVSYMNKVKDSIRAARKPLTRQTTPAKNVPIETESPIIEIP